MFDDPLFAGPKVAVGRRVVQLSEVTSRVFRLEGPLSASLWALCRTRSQIASATVAEHDGRSVGRRQDQRAAIDVAEGKAVDARR